MGFTNKTKENNLLTLGSTFTMVAKYKVKM